MEHQRLYLRTRNLQMRRCRIMFFPVFILSWLKAMFSSLLTNASIGWTRVSNICMLGHHETFSYVAMMAMGEALLI